MIFEVDVIFRQPDHYTQHVVWSTVVGHISVDSHRCHLEAILSRYNVDKYRITWCEHKGQVMEEWNDIPKHYYEEVTPIYRDTDSIMYKKED